MKLGAGVPLHLLASEREGALAREPERWPALLGAPALRQLQAGALARLQAPDICHIKLGRQAPTSARPVPMVDAVSEISGPRVEKITARLRSLPDLDFWSMFGRCWLIFGRCLFDFLVDVWSIFDRCLIDVGRLISLRF